MGVEPIQHFFIREPGHGIFYLEEQDQIAFNALKSFMLSHYASVSFSTSGKILSLMISLELSKHIEDIKGENF